MGLNANNLDFVFAFLGGFAISFTPCVYPLLPITIGIIGIESITSRTRGFILSLLFVSGMSITYATLGLIAALTGKYFGKISAHAFSQFFVGGVISVFALALLGIIKIPTLEFSVKRRRLGKNDFISVFIMGLVSGLAVGPCTAPALAAILAYVSSKQNILYAMFLLMSFAYGMGLLLILAGTFSGILVNLPKSGQWMVRIKKVLGIGLLIWGIYFISVGIRRL